MKVAVRTLRLLKTGCQYMLKARGAEHLSLPDQQALMRQFCEDFSSVLGLEYQVSGTPCEQPCLIAPNHISWHDVFAIGLHAAPHFVAKAEVEQWPLFGYLGKKGETLFINRGNRQAAQVIAAQMRERLAQRSVLVFPEGTTSSGIDVARFKRRLFAPAIEQASLIQPVALHYYSTDQRGNALGYTDESFLRHFWRSLRTANIQIGIHYCEPFYPADIALKGDTNAMVAIAEETQKRVEQAKHKLSTRSFVRTH